MQGFRFRRRLFRRITPVTLVCFVWGALIPPTSGANTITSESAPTSDTRSAISQLFADIGLTTRFVPLPGGILLEKQGSDYTAPYTHGNGQVRKDSEYPLYDGIGSERTVTAANQTVSGTITFEGFGQTIATTGSSSNPYMFKGGFGYRNDGDTGLHHVGARYYDAQVGRFITHDTVLSEHAYLYCEHDPINRADPSGHFPPAIALAPYAISAGAMAIAAYRLWRAAQTIQGLGYLLMASAFAESIRQNHWLSQTPFDREFEDQFGRPPTKEERRKIHLELPKWKEPVPGNDNPDVPPELAPEIIEHLWPNGPKS